jgi:hypothetical protein
MSVFELNATCEWTEVRAALERYRDVAIPAARRDALVEGLVAGVDAAADQTPVETGRARAAWQAGLAELGGAPAASGVANSSPDDVAVTRTETETSTALAVENHVPYIALLEFGTRGQPPRRMGITGREVAREVALEGLPGRLTTVD